MFTFLISTVDAGVNLGEKFPNTKYSAILPMTATSLLYESLQLLDEIMLLFLFSI